jgi:hypothetical protein
MLNTYLTPSKKMDTVKAVGRRYGMKNYSSFLLFAVCSIMIFFHGIASADTFESAVSQAMQTLKVSKGDPGLLILTDAPYVKVDGACALPRLAQAQEKTGCTVGKGNLLFFSGRRPTPFG